MKISVGNPWYLHYVYTHAWILNHCCAVGFFQSTSQVHYPTSIQEHQPINWSGWIGKFQLKLVKIQSIWEDFPKQPTPFNYVQLPKCYILSVQYFLDSVGLQEVNTQIAVSNLLGSTARPPCGLRTSITSSSRPKATTNVAESWWTLKVPPTLQHIFYGNDHPRPSYLYH